MNRIIEVLLVIILVEISVPVWQSFAERANATPVTTIDDYSLQFTLHNNSNKEEIIVTNNYYLNKSYSIYLKVNKDIDLEKSTITINDKNYKLEDFYRLTDKDNYTYTIANDYLMAGSKTYNIIPHIVGMSVYYSYIFEENTNF